MDPVVPPDSQERSAQEPKLVRTYQAWEGSNIFCLGGRLIFGPDVQSLFLTIFLIVAPVAVFCIFVARKLWNHFSGNSGMAVMIVSIVLTVYVLALLLLTSGRDPGIIPRSDSPPLPESNHSNLSIWQGLSPRLPRTKDVVINGITVKVKYCDTCMHYRPPRCSHCSICDNCVDQFDHHCPWVGQCIGLRNYRFFFMFVFTATLLCLYVHGFCWVYIKMIMNSEKTTIWKAMVKTPASIALIIYSFLSLWFVGGLSVFHLYLISTNQSTYENFRYRYSLRNNPYNKGIIGNFMEVFFSPIPPSKNKFREKVQEKPAVPALPINNAFGSTNSSSIKWEQDKQMWGETEDGFLSMGSGRVGGPSSDHVMEDRYEVKRE